MVIWIGLLLRLENERRMDMKSSRDPIEMEISLLLLCGQNDSCYCNSWKKKGKIDDDSIF